MVEAPQGPHTELRRTVADAFERFIVLDAAGTACKPSPEKWSAREILGHLVDSALNNHRRFVLAALHVDQPFDGYQQDEWVSVQSYNDYDWRDLISLWRAVNLHLAHVVEHIPASERLLARSEQHPEAVAFDVDALRRSPTLDALARDYVVHVRHHLDQIYDRIGT